MTRIPSLKVTVCLSCDTNASPPKFRSSSSTPSAFIFDWTSSSYKPTSNILNKSSDTESLSLVSLGGVTHLMSFSNFITPAEL
ncbi:hypothetical protein PsorP6_009930 [Peronosclerospora sorghi]|uniref:Uncharacterized protein n=1 Tax=Peronosclerospora sorghi TaxID=230839 RepID=A0ACC0VUN3_9STRA|nr:hypothetical protein PsorP6_009930 [Peronosclerospora sorghi]